MSTLYIHLHLRPTLYNIYSLAPLPVRRRPSLSNHPPPSDSPPISTMSAKCVYEGAGAMIG
ncbi:hypothetical protein E2C01_085226 [Portunus trituberculatus]|uniref:Uncharacterized protein n=1 Tax=Portunus trituberculatus TaxID=210409 RepID=A0A5B7J0E3_PORTR|nr:hypothetical protein [Portunus trituberculatus]